LARFQASRRITIRQTFNGSEKIWHCVSLKNQRTKNALT
jgi:hypothetical protein